MLINKILKYDEGGPDPYKPLLRTWSTTDKSSNVSKVVKNDANAARVKDNLQSSPTYGEYIPKRYKDAKVNIPQLNPRPQNGLPDYTPSEMATYNKRHEFGENAKSSMDLISWLGGPYAAGAWHAGKAAYQVKDENYSGVLGEVGQFGTGLLLGKAFTSLGADKAIGEFTNNFTEGLKSTGYSQIFNKPKPKFNENLGLPNIPEQLNINTLNSNSFKNEFEIPQELYIPETANTSNINSARPTWFNIDRFPATRDESLIRQLSDKHRFSYEAKYGSDYEAKDLALYARIQEANNLDRLYTTRMAAVKNLDEEFISKHNIRTKYTPEEEIIADSYTRGHDAKLNYFDRGTMGPEAKFYQEEVAPKLENLITSNKLKSPQTLRRDVWDYEIGTAWRNGEPLPHSTKFSELEPGDIWEPRSFVSTGLPGTSYNQGMNSILSEIEAPAGQSVFYPNASGVKNFQGETEVLLPRKLKFKVESKNLDKSFKSWEEVPDGYVGFDNHSKIGNDVYFRGERVDDLSQELKKKLFLETNKKATFKHSIVNPYMTIPGIGLGALMLNNK